VRGRDAPDLVAALLQPRRVPAGEPPPGTFSLEVWDLPRVRQQLAGLGLDWDLPPYPPADQPDAPGPPRVRLLSHRQCQAAEPSLPRPAPAP
jgi:hypothetical protein